MFRRHPARRWPLLLAAAALLALGALWVANASTGETQVDRRIERVHALADPAFARDLGVLLGPPFLDGNRVTALFNGDRILPPMLAAIRAAQTSITFETYIYWSGDIGRAFADALAERARHGVKVHVLLDWVGSAKMDEQLIDDMRADIQVHKFHTPHWSKLGRLNDRTHRKVLVVDGKVAFTGGVGIAPQWTGNAQDPQHWRDTRFQVERPVAAQMQAVFIDNWIKVTGDVLHGPAYFAELALAGPSRAQMFRSWPSGGSESMQLMYLLALSAATRSIDLSAAFFVPDELTLAALLEALQRGVKLRIVVPGEHIDSDTVRSASRATWGPLLRAGALIAGYAPTMYHSKVMIVDGQLVSVGSTNFDNRSFRLNDEATLNVLDADFAAAQTAAFEADLGLSRRVTYAEWLNRPLRERIGERLASMFGSQL